MKYLLNIFFLLLIVIGLSACGAGESNTNTSNPSIVSFNGFSSEQWYLQKDTDFYTTNLLNSDAHIHPDTNTYQTYTGQGVKIAIIDDGFDTNHPEIKDKIIATSYVKDDGTIIEDVSHTYKSDHHGTAVTGIIASLDDGVEIRGIAPNVELILLKMPDLLSDSNVIKLFDEAVKYGADIVSCSWGTGEVSQTVRNHINTLASTGRNGKGLIVVFASGNNDTQIGDDESGIENVIAVGATDGDNLRTPYSNYGATLDIVAPGGYYDSIATIDPIGDAGVSPDGYNRYNQVENSEEISFIGTSASAPIISGSIALLLQKNPNLTRVEVEEKLKTSTDTIGQNTPYIDDMISSNSKTPTITGLLGTTRNSAFKVKLTSKDTNTHYGLFDVSVINDDKWQSQVNTTLPYGNYNIELIDRNSATIWATDEDFVIASNLPNNTDTTKRKSDFYGYGKINLSKLLQ